MSAPIRRVAWLLVALMAVMVLNLQVQQVIRSDEVADGPGNRRAVIERFERPRGVIVLGDEAAARSVRTTPGSEFDYRRTYPLGTRAAHVVGWSSVVVGTSGIERAYDGDLTASSPTALAADLAELLGAQDTVGDAVRLTLDPEVQAAAERALAGRVGAVVALDPRTGAVLAHASAPVFDPSPLADLDAGAALAAWNAYRADPTEPLRDRAANETYPPGSTFKLVVAAAALEAGIPPTTSFPDVTSFRPSIGRPITNFGGGTCDGGGTITLARALAVSCNVVFASLGVQLGVEDLREQARRFGFDRELPYDLPTATSRFPEQTDEALLAQAGIGQFDVRASALQMAVLTAAIVDDGTLRRPYVARDVRDETARLVRGPQAGEWQGAGYGSEAISTRTAEQLRELMVATVREGTGTRAAIPGVLVGGKTGTAQDPSDPTPTAWFVGFAEDRVAVAVVLPDAGGEGGGVAAAPIARAVMEAALRDG